MKTVKEVSKISGVSIRTLHYYDEIGLLRPTEVTDAGYRLYDDIALARLQSILLFRELQFPLKEICKILDSKNFDYKTAIDQQIHLLELQEKHIKKLITFAREIKETGVTNMDFSPFDKKEIEDYSKKAKQMWGETKEYKEYESKSKNRSVQDETDINKGLMNIFAEFGKIKNLSPNSDDALKLVKKLQRYITDNFYNCTKEILASLGAMYKASEDFANNIDKSGGKGTTGFVSKAIENYCK